MLVKKKDTIERLKEEYLKIKNEVEKIPDEALIEGVEIFCSNLNGVSLYGRNLDSLDQLYSMLHKLKEKIGNYKMNNYWIPYSGCVCMDYYFGKIRFWASIITENEDEIVTVLSNGKCFVTKKEEKTITCEL